MQKLWLGSPAQLVSSQKPQEDLTGPSGRPVWVLTKCAALAGGGLGGSRRAGGAAGAAACGDVRLTYSDRSTSSWGAQEPTNESWAQPAER